jgi:hypothetical protein
MSKCSVEKCERSNWARGLCDMHYHRQQAGRPMDAAPLIAPVGTAIAWLREAVKTETDECIPWPYTSDKNGYGKVVWEGRDRKAHHIALILVGREAPKPPLQTRHLCGNGHLGCVNLRHLINGTPAENSTDTIIHSRSLRGERSRTSKLTEAQAREILAATGSVTMIAEQYGVSRSQAHRIRLRQAWAWLE